MRVVEQIAVPPVVQRFYRRVVGLSSEKVEYRIVDFNVGYCHTRTEHLRALIEALAAESCKKSQAAEEAAWK